MNSSVSISLSVALAATLLSLLPALLAAWYMERSRLPGRSVLETIVMLPLVLPPVVLGYLMLKVFSPRGTVGSFLAGVGLPVAFHWFGAVVAAAVAGFPLFVMMISLAMRAVDARFETIARSLGRGRWATFWRVTLPLSWPGIVAGGVLAFARGLGEFGATIVLAGRIPGETETIPLRIYAELDAPGGEARIGGLVAASVIFCIVSVAAARFIDRRWRMRLELDR